jgi:hypothetical protein
MGDPAAMESVVTPDIPLNAIDSDRVRAFDTYWQAKCRHGKFPTRCDIDPVEIKSLLPYLLISEIETAPFRVRYRLDGSETASINGSITNHYLDEIDQPAEIRAALTEAYRLCVAERRPVYAQHYVLLKSGLKWPATAGIWPLANPAGSEIDRCVALEDYPELP